VANLKKYLGIATIPYPNKMTTLNKPAAKPNPIIQPNTPYLQQIKVII
jgi:hypothetical protein